MVGLYYSMNVDYASLLWEEFGTSIFHCKLATGVASARIWGLILKEFYNQENILIPLGVVTAKFPTMKVPKMVVNDATIFLVFRRIPDSMVNLVDPKNQLLVEFLAYIDSTPTGVLPPKVFFHQSFLQKGLRF